MRRVVITSRNPNKTETVRSTICEAFPDINFEFLTVIVKSGAASLPHGLVEIEKGARTRIKNAKKISPRASFYIGIEGGIIPFGGTLGVTTIIVVQNDKGICGIAQSSTCQLPAKVINLIDDKEYGLGGAIDKLSCDTNSKRKGGAEAYLTRGLIQRSELQRITLISALVPFLRPSLYNK